MMFFSWQFVGQLQNFCKCQIICFYTPHKASKTPLYASDRTVKKYFSFTNNKKINTKTA